MAATKVLLVEDDDSTRRGMTLALEQDGFEVTAVIDGAAAIQRLKRRDFDVGVFDVMTGQVSGIDALEFVVRHRPSTAVIMVTGYATIEAAVDAMKLGAYDFLTKPIDIEKLALLIRKCAESRRLQCENLRLQEALRERFSVGNIIGRSPRMLELFRQLEQVAETDATVLLRGESGVGKELCASAIHYNGARHAKQFVRVSCAALGSGVLESELFGHERGAFTGAVRTRAGRFEQADGGTILLDEVGDLDAGMQMKLLRVLQEREFERVGGNETIQVDVRVIAATNRELERAVEAGEFREDLYYRLNVVTIKVPALRERPGDIPLLADSFLRDFVGRHGKAIRKISRGAASVLAAYPWPGNVRELRNCIESLVVTSRGPTIELDDLPPHLRAGEDVGPRTIEVPLGASLERIEHDAIIGTLAAVGGNKTKAARLLGIGLKTLYRRLEEYGYEE